MSKEFTCVICGCSVSRPKSAAYKNGRACRHHEEVQADLAVREEARAESLDKSIDSIKNPRKPQWARSPEPVRLWKCQCFSCKSPAIKKEDLAAAMLEGMAYAKKNGDNSLNFFDPNNSVAVYARNKLGIKENDEVVEVTRYDVSAFSTAKLTALAKGNRDIRDFMQFAKMALLCKECASNFGLSQPTPSLEQLVALAPVAQLVIDEMAQKM